jgi:hypothetical protein
MWTAQRNDGAPRVSGAAKLDVKPEVAASAGRIVSFT